MKVTTGTFVATPLIREYVNEVLDSGRIGYGEKSREFEQSFAKLHGAKYGLVSNSGTSSLHVALQAMKELHGWADGDEVIVPATTFVATANIVTHCQMTPVFVDVELNYYGINGLLIERAITDRTRAIIPVHLFGQPCNMFLVSAVADANNLKIIEDSCETMFAKYDGVSVGSLGDIACFSLYVAHLLVAGVGGVGITSNPDYAAKMRSLVNHGLRLEDLNLDENMSPQHMVGRQFLFDALGHSFRITEFESAIALAQLAEYEDMLKIRQRNGKHYTASIDLINLDDTEQPFYRPARVMGGNEHAYMMYPIVINERDGKWVDKRPLTKFLNEHDVETRDMLPILNQPAYSYLDPKDFPVSAQIVKSGFYVGCHQGLTPKHVQYVLNLLVEFAKRNY